MPCEEVSGRWRRCGGVGLGVGTIDAKDRSTIIGEEERGEWDFVVACC